MKTAAISGSPTLEMLRHASRMELIASLMPGALHELNQPLAAMVNYTNGCRIRLGRMGPGMEEVMAALDQVNVLKDRVIGQVQSLREWASWREARPIEVTLTEGWIARALSLLGPTLNRQAILFKTIIPSPAVTVRMDPLQLQEIFLHLARNSAEALLETPPEKRRLELRAETFPEKIEITLADTGPGIGPTLQPQLFTPFFSTKPLGLGMGLVYCREILQAHGGDIRHRPDWQEGAAFTLSLPTVPKE